MATYDLSECYSKLDQQELSRIVSRMITRAFVGKPYLAIDPNPHPTNSGRWISNPNEKLSNEFLYDAKLLKEDVKFLINSAYIEWLGEA